MCQQGWWHDRLEYLGIPGLLFKLAVSINLPVMLDNLRFGAFQNKLRTDILLPDAGQCMPVGVYFLIVRQIHDSLFHRQRRTELFQRALFLPAMTRDTDFLLRILRRFRVGLLFRFLRRVEQAELLIPVVKNVCPLLTALSELGTLKIQDDLSESLNLLILLPALFPERIHGALQHGILLPELLKNLHQNPGLFHAACTTLHA